MALLGLLGSLTTAILKGLYFSHREKRRQSPGATLSRAPDPQEETFEEQEVRLDKKIIPVTNISSSFPDEAVMPPPPTLADDLKQFQDFIKRLMDSSQTPLEESQHNLLNILHTFSFAHIVLPINETFLDPAKII